MYRNTPFRDNGPSVLVYHHGPGALGWAVLALQLLLLLGIAWLIASLAFRRPGRRPAAAPASAPAAQENAALETLHMRYARGEIGRDEYLQARSDLGGDPLSVPGQPTPA